MGVVLDKNGREIDDKEVQYLAKGLGITEEAVKKWITEGFLRKVVMSAYSSNDDLDRQVQMP